MSPRAAWRLETLGFGDVYDYVDGKNDWMAAGLPTEGTNAEHPRAVDVVRKDVPTCGLKEKLGDVKARVRAKELEKDPELLIEQAMRPAPSTFRTFVALHEMLHKMVDHKLESSPITTSDGRLVGLLLQKDVAAALEKDK